MAPLLAAGIMAAMGLAKSELIDKKKEDRQRERAVTTTKYSPWTGLKAGPIEEADPLGSAMTWGMTGASAASNMNMQDAYTNRMNSGGSPIGYGKSVPAAGGADFPQLKRPEIGDSYTQSYNNSPWSWEGGAPPSETYFTQARNRVPSWRG